MDAEANSVIHAFAASRTHEDHLDLIALLEYLHHRRRGPAIVDTLDVSSEAVYRRLGELRDLEFVADLDGERFEATRAGTKAANSYQRAATQLGDATIAYLVGSESRPQLLTRLADAPARKATLAADESLPSRTTIQRVIAQFDEYGWIQRTDEGAFQLTQPAIAAYEEYERLHTAMTQAVEKAPCLRLLAEWANPPLDVLTETELVVKRDDDPHAMLDAAVEAADIRDRTLSHVRSVTPLFDPLMFDIFGEFVDLGTQFEVIFDQQAYSELTKPANLHYFAGALVAPNVQVRIHPDTLKTGLGIYDRTVLLGGSTVHDQEAGVTGSSEQFREWADTTFETVWNESVRPSQRLQSWLGTTLSTASD